MFKNPVLSLLGAALFAMVLAACGSDPKAASTCTANDDCPDGQTCLTNFKGGYCGKADCTKAEDCPDGTACIKQGATNYCFLTCTDKADCNENRASDVEANCSSNVETAEGKKDSKACVPPSA